MSGRTSLSLLALLLACPAALAAEAGSLPGTRPLTLEGDISSQLVTGVDRFLLGQIEEAGKNREKFYKRDYSSPENYAKSLEPNRKRLAHILGLRDARVPFKAPELVATLDEPALVGKGKGYEIRAVRWPALDGIHGEGLLLEPAGRMPLASVVAIPDADVTPEQLAGLAPGLAEEAQYARHLAEAGCRVLVPVLIDRTFEARAGRARMTSREFLYRSAFELGRHLIGYELQKVLAGVDWFAHTGGEKAKIGVIGWGEGGMLALYAGALDSRIQSVCVAGYFGNRDRIWEGPIDRNVFGLLEQFGDAELAALIHPRRCVIGAIPGPERKFPSEGGAPAVLSGPAPEETVKEAERAKEILQKKDSLAVVQGWNRVIQTFGETLGAAVPAGGKAPESLRKEYDSRSRQARQFQEIDRFNQRLLEESPYVREKYMSKLDTSSLAKYEKTVEPYREFFATEVVGRFDLKPLPFNARTRKYEETDRWTAYEVVLDVFPDVIAYGYLLIPKDIKAGERRPVVVCQHGLEGRPAHVVNGEGKEGYPYYKAFAARLAERGFVTFAPQNLYLFRDRFRTLQRKANPIKKTLFSVIVPQHQQITDWLKTLEFVDGKRIGFYGLSYGGKSAMRIPPLVKNYSLSICSADFNDWVWKNASSRAPHSYVWTMEYEIFEFDLGSTFNYSEMAALIAPRPFMVERGHFDGVAPDERVALEFAKVRNLYQAKLGLKDRAAIEWFVGPHSINGKGTFEFLHKHLSWPATTMKKP